MGLLMVVLPELQYDIVRSLSESGGRLDASSLAAKVGKRPEDLMRDLEELRAKGFISISYELVNEVSLTDIGQAYLKNGLPEERLRLTLSKQGSARLSELKETLGLDDNELAAALGRLRRFGLVEVRGDLVVLRENLMEGFEKYLADVKGFLDRLREGPIQLKELPSIAEELRRRGMVKVRQVKRIIVELTQSAKDMLAKGELVGARVVTSLTSQDIVTGAWRGLVFKEFDLSIEIPPRPISRKHPFMDFLNYIRDELVAMGFEEVKDNHVDIALWNFDVLLVPQFHPARRETDVFYVKGGVKVRQPPQDVVERTSREHYSMWHYSWRGELAMRILLRTHTTLVTIRQIHQRGGGEYRVFSLDRVYRPDTPDATHFIEFNQLEGIIVGKDVSFRNLLGFFTELAKRLRLGEAHFKPAYFPFTEPSVEGYVVHPKLGPLEVFPGGMFRPEVLRSVGLSTDYKVAAWGVGIDRIAMVALGIDDIRDLYTNNVKLIDSMRGWVR